jgi:hypothetical protein
MACTRTLVPPVVAETRATHCSDSSDGVPGHHTRTEAPPEHRAASDSLAPSTPHSGYGSKIETEIYSTIWQPYSEQADLAPAVHPEENNLVICRGKRGGVCHMGVGLDEVGEGNIQARSHPRTDRAIEQVHTSQLHGTAAANQDESHTKCQQSIRPRASGLHSLVESAMI